MNPRAMLKIPRSAEIAVSMNRLKTKIENSDFKKNLRELTKLMKTLENPFLEQKIKL